VSIGESEDFLALPVLSGANGDPSFFAPLKGAPMKVSSNGNRLRERECPANFRSTRSNWPSRTHYWKRWWQVWCGRYRSGMSCHFVPVSSTHIPFRTTRVSGQGRPQWFARRGGCGIGAMNFHCSSVTSQRPRIGRLADSQSATTPLPRPRSRHVLFCFDYVGDGLL